MKLLVCLATAIVCCLACFIPATAQGSQAKCLPYDKLGNDPGRPELDPEYIYRKYEANESAVLTFLPLPKLTPEAVKEFEPAEMIVEAVLRNNGTVANIVFRGFLKNGMGASVTAAVRRIKFRAAKMNGCPVSQRIALKYGIKRCRKGRICTYALEFVE